MGITLFPHQVDAVAATDAEFERLGDVMVDGVARRPNVCLVLPTGAGKTLVKAYYAKRCRDTGEPCIIFAHRDVLLGQISDALCMMGVYHSFIASTPMMRNITDTNAANYNGNSFYEATSSVVVASVDKFRASDVTHVAPMYKMWMLDEAHHLKQDSKWHQCVEKLPNARGLSVTATPWRGDKAGLGRHASGVNDALVVGTDMATLIKRGRLSKYKVYTPPVKLDVEGMRATAGGDYNQKELAKRTDNDGITGDAIEHYLEHAAGKQAICFCVNIDHSRHVADKFRKAGIEAVALSSNDTIAVRNRQISLFKAGVTKVLINCDLFGEGFDVPAVEVCIMLRKTLSFSLFKQQFGRCLRVIKGKEFGILLDHVGNVAYHMLEQGLTMPHEDPVWSLDNRVRKSKDNTKPKPIRVCPKCFAYYIPKVMSVQECPDCTHVETKVEAEAAEKKFAEKKGKLVEMTFEKQSMLHVEKTKVDENPQSKKNRLIQAGMSDIVVNSTVKQQIIRCNAQSRLRRSIVDWCNVTVFNENFTRDQMHDAFEVTFGIDTLSAQCLSAKDADALRELIDKNEGYDS